MASMGCEVDLLTSSLASRTCKTCSGERKLSLPNFHRLPIISTLLPPLKKESETH